MPACAPNLVADQRHCCCTLHHSMCVGRASRHTLRINCSLPLPHPILNTSLLLPLAGDPVLWQGQGGGEDTRVLPAPNQRHRCAGRMEGGAVDLGGAGQPCLNLPGPPAQQPAALDGLLLQSCLSIWLQRPVTPKRPCRVPGSGGRRGRADHGDVTVGGIPGGAS